MTTTSASIPPPRGKDHKVGKAISLSLIWCGLAVVAILTIATLVATLPVSKKTGAVALKDVSATTAPIAAAQPLSVKIVATDTATLVLNEEVVQVGEYDEVWKQLTVIVPPGADEELRYNTIQGFLSGLGFFAETFGGTIKAKATGNAVTPSTLTCYINGYVPGKPYIKANCPAY